MKRREELFKRINEIKFPIPTRALLIAKLIDSWIQEYNDVANAIELVNEIEKYLEEIAKQLIHKEG